MSIAKTTNNIFNIRFVPTNRWVGQVGEYKGFSVFQGKNFALRAMLFLMRTYFKRGDNTIQKVLMKFAPPTENNTEAYIKFVAGRVYGVDWKFCVDKEIEYGSDEFKGMLIAMAWMETRTLLYPHDIDKVANYYKLW